MRNVLVQSLLASRIDGKLERDWVHRDSDALAVITVSQLPRAAICDLVLIPSTLPLAMLWAVRTAIAPRIEILSYGSEAALWSWCLREMGASGVQEFVRRPQSEASVEPRDHTVAFQEDAPEAALLLDLRTLVAEDIETALNEASAGTATGPRRKITFDDGSHVFVSESSMLQVLEEGEQLKSKRARDIKAADLVLVTNSGPLNNIFEVLRDRVDSQTSLARAVEIVNAYHSLLLHAFQVSGLTHQQLLHRLRSLGSTILHTISIVEWVDGERFGPSDPLDIERLGSTLGIEVFSKYDQFYAAMQRVRVAHRELGRALVRIVRASFKEADASSIRLTIDGEEIVMYDVSEAIAIKRVVSAEFVAVTDEQSIPQELPVRPL